IAQDWTNSTALRQRHVIEIKRARRRHPVINGQDHLSCQSSDCSRRRYHDDLVQPIDDNISCENQDRPPLIGKPKRIPADLTTLPPTSSQPAASQASGSSSAENSSREGRTDRQTGASEPCGNAINRSRRTRSRGVTDATSRRMSSAVKGLAIDCILAGSPSQILRCQSPAIRPVPHPYFASAVRVERSVFSRLCLGKSRMIGSTIQPRPVGTSRVSEMASHSSHVPPSRSSNRQ